MILLAVCLVGIVSMFALNNQVLLPLASTDLLGGGAAVYGFLGAASGIGSLISSLSMAFGQRPTIRLLLVGAGALGLSMVLLGLSTWLPVSLLIMVLAGWGLIAMAATTNTVIQLTVPDELRGRVMSVYTTIFAGASPIGAIFAGALAATGRAWRWRWRSAALLALGAVGIAVLAGRCAARASAMSTGVARDAGAAPVARG